MYSRSLSCNGLKSLDKVGVNDQISLNYINILI